MRQKYTLKEIALQLFGDKPDGEIASEREIVFLDHLISSLYDPKNAGLIAYIDGHSNKGTEGLIHFRNVISGKSSKPKSDEDSHQKASSALVNRDDWFRYLSHKLHGFNILINPLYANPTTCIKYFCKHLDRSPPSIEQVRKYVKYRQFVKEQYAKYPFWDESELDPAPAAKGLEPAPTTIKKKHDHFRKLFTAYVNGLSTEQLGKDNSRIINSQAVKDMAIHSGLDPNINPSEIPKKAWYLRIINARRNALAVNKSKGGRGKMS